MPKIEKKWFIIDSAVGPIYSEPNFHSSCLSEAVYGESCEILDKQDIGLKLNVRMGTKVGSIPSMVLFQTKKINHLILLHTQGKVDALVPSIHLVQWWKNQ